MIRKRRVKCDERRPKCLRCDKLCLVCEYEKEGDKKFKDVSAPDNGKLRTIRPIIRKPDGRQHRIEPLSGLDVPRFSFSLENETERRYVGHFLHKTTTGFEGTMDWMLWNHVVIQFSHHQPFVRYFIIAIGALLKSFETPHQSQILPGRKGKEGPVNLHHKFALLKYGTAVKAMQAALVDTEPRQTLIACLLIFCFEMLLQNTHPALFHFISGQRLLHNWRGRELDTKGRPPSSLALEDEVCEAFDHLDMQISTISDQRPPELHQEILLEGVEFVRQMPSKFYDFEEAQRYLNLIMRRSHHFMATTWGKTNTAALSRDFEIKAPDGVPVAFNIYSTSNIIPSTLPTEQKPYMRDILRWQDAFAPVFQKSRIPSAKGLRTYHRATLLKIHGIATRISLAGLLFDEECAYDAFLPEFREMLDLIHVIVDAYHKRSVSGNDNSNINGNGKVESRSPSDSIFSLDLGITPPLFLLLIRCRDRVLRRHAIALLRTWHKEVCWHPAMIVEIGVFLMEVEEEGCQEGERIPEVNRAVVTRICEEPDAVTYKKTVVQLVQRRGGADGEMMWRERLFTYTM